MMTNYTSRAIVAAALMVAGLASAAVRADDAAGRVAAGDVTVTVKYGGKGTVDANHKIWVWLFTSPEIGPGAMPIAETSVDKNGAPASFVNIGAEQVWIAVAYDEGGGFAGSAPPPSGSPISIYSGDGKGPTAVTPGPKAKVTIALTDATRMQ
jgi:hypothetical protein